MYLLKSSAKMHRPYLTLKRKAGVHPAIKFHLVRHAQRCPWRIPEITRRWASGRGRDSAAATGTKKSLMARPRRLRIWQSPSQARLRTLSIEIILKEPEFVLQIGCCPE